MTSYFKNDANQAAAVNFNGIQRFAHYFDENCLMNPYIVSKSKSDNRSSNGDDFSVRRWISAPKLSRVDDSSCLFFGGAAF